MCADFPASSKVLFLIDNHEDVKDFWWVETGKDFLRHEAYDQPDCPQFNLD